MIERLARRRDPYCDFPNPICEEEEDIKRYLEIDLGEGRNNSTFSPDPKRTPRPKAGRNVRRELPPQTPQEWNQNQWTRRPWHPAQNYAEASQPAPKKGEGKKAR